MKAFGFAVILISTLAGCASAPEIDFNEQMGKAVDSREKIFHACYKKYGEKKNAATSVKYSLSYTGGIQFAEIDPDRTENSSPELNACVLKEFKALKLPEVQGYDGARGSYTFHYSTH